MIGIVRLYHDSYGNNVGSRIFCELSNYFGGLLITDNKKIIEMEKYKTISHKEAVQNRQKFTKLIVYNSKANMFGGLAPKHTPLVCRLIMSIPEVYYYTSDPILDLQLSVPDSHERAVPGLRQAINKIIHLGIRMDNSQTDFIRFFASKIKVKVSDEKKKWCIIYFGNARNEKRQRQIESLLENKSQSSLIIGHESEKFPWLYYTPDFYKLLSSAYVTPIIGDDKLHYEKQMKSIRLYETWYSTAIGLIDLRFGHDDILDSCISDHYVDMFYFKDVADFKKKAAEIKNNKSLYETLFTAQRKALKKLISRYENKQFDWKKVLKAKTEKRIADKKEKALKRKQKLNKIRSKYNYKKQK